MSAHIGRAIRACDICQASKNSNHSESIGTRRLFVGRPWQVVSIDLVGPFTQTPRGNKMVLVLSDQFTRWRDAIPLPDGTTESIANVLDQRILRIRI